MKVILKIIASPFVFVFTSIKRLVVRRQLQNIRMSAIDGLSGYDFEKFIASVFFAAGYTAKLSGKGADKGVDIFASRRRTTIVVQTKMYYNNKVTNSAVQQIYAAKSYHQAHVAIAVTNWFFTSAAMDLAEKLNVLLIDRQLLTDILRGKSLKTIIQQTHAHPPTF